MYGMNRVRVRVCERPSSGVEIGWKTELGWKPEDEDVTGYEVPRSWRPDFIQLNMVGSGTCHPCPYSFAISRQRRPHFSTQMATFAPVKKESSTVQLQYDLVDNSTHRNDSPSALSAT